MMEPDSWGDVAAITVVGLFLGRLALSAWRASRRVSEALDLVTKELQTNDGKSMKDRVDLLTLGQAKTAESVEALRVETLEVKADVKAGALQASKESSAIWATLARHGIGRRRSDRRDRED